MDQLNEVFLNRMKTLLQDDYDEFLQSLKQPQVKSLYVNENKIDVENFKKIVDFNVEKIPYENAGFYVDNEVKGRHPLHHAGAFYFQEPSAMFTVNAYKFKGNETVLDMCSAPGGKSIQIANRIKNGVLVSNEINKSRCEILYSNVERMGLKNVIITNEKPQNLATAYAGCFDVCLVDAPCSGEGMFRKGSDMVESWNPGLNEICAIRQLEILDSADKVLKTNGILIYSTCTYSVEENENVVRKFMEEYGYELKEISNEHMQIRGVDMPEAVRLYPHKVKGEGQFVAVLQKISQTTENFGNNIKLTTSQTAKNFVLSATNKNFDCYEYKNFVYNVPNLGLIKKNINYLSIGVRVGEITNKRFQPYHYFFTAYGGDCKNVIACRFQDDKVKKYLKGETFETELSDGYGAFLIDKCPVGGFKVSKGQFKNYYPKGLRNFK